MNLILLYGVPALIALGAAWLARRQVRLPARIGLGALLAIPVITAWHGVSLGNTGANAVSTALWAVIWSTPAWVIALVLGATFMRSEEP